MLKRLIKIAIFILLAGLIASLLSQDQGTARLEWLGWRIEARTSLLITLMALLIWLVVLFDRFIGALIGLPSRLAGRLHARRQQQAHDALAVGLAAAAAGDGHEALRQAKKAKRLMGASPLTEVLGAEAASLTGDNDAARRSFKSLSENKATAFFGAVGLMRLEAGRGDHKAALKVGRQALEMHKKTPAFAKALYALEAQHGNWQEAIDALSVAYDDPKLAQADKDRFKKAFATLFYCQFLEMQSESDESDEAGQIKRLTKALSYESGMPPLVLATAECYQSLGQDKKARAVLEAGIKRTPHPQVIIRLFEVLGGDAKALSALISLLERYDNPSDGLMAVARLAMGLRLWGEAKRLLEMAPPTSRDLQYWQITADLAEHAPTPEKRPKGKATKNESPPWPERSEALSMASGAPRPSGWHCANCHSILADWHPHCEQCGHFATIGWGKTTQS